MEQYSEDYIKKIINDKEYYEELSASYDIELRKLMLKYDTDTKKLIRELEEAREQLEKLKVNNNIPFEHFKKK